MVDILADAESFDHDDSLDHGSELVRWNSHENLVPMTLVCRAWTDAAIHILFGSVALFGGAAAALFLRTLEVRPWRAALVRSLVIGLRYEEETSEVEGDNLSESNLLVKALEACPRLKHLQVRPLHAGVRDRIFSSINAKSLASLVIAPRQGNRGVAWSRGLFRQNDVAALVTDSLQRLELDFWTPHLPPTPIESSAILVVSLPPLIITHLRIFATVSDQLLFRVIEATGSCLEVVDIYFETVPGHQGVLDAFRPASSTLKSLRFTTNPTCRAIELFGPNKGPPPFDILLTYLRNLEELFVSASEVSQSVFRLLGPTIRHLEIEALNDRSAF